jgi:hypothetical protein
MKRPDTHDFVKKFTTGDKLHDYVYLCLAGHHLHERTHHISGQIHIEVDKDAKEGTKGKTHQATGSNK